MVVKGSLRKAVKRLRALSDPRRRIRKREDGRASAEWERHPGPLWFMKEERARPMPKN